MRRSVPFRTFDGWDDPAPRFMGAEHIDGPTAPGSFIQTLSLNRRCYRLDRVGVLMVRETAVLSQVRKRMPLRCSG